MTGLAQWAVPVAERRRLRFSFQNQQCQRADRRSGPQPDLSITEPLSEEGRSVGSAVFSEPRSLCQSPLCSASAEAVEPPEGEERCF